MGEICIHTQAHCLQVDCLDMRMYDDFNIGIGRGAMQLGDCERESK